MTNKDQLNVLKRQRAYLVECRDSCESLSFDDMDEKYPEQLSQVFSSNIKVIDELIKLKKLEAYLDTLPKETK